MPFKSGDRIKVIAHVRGGGHNMKNELGTLIGAYQYKSWYVRMDNHDGFQNQRGCWIIRESDMVTLDFDNNEEALILLKKL